MIHHQTGTRYSSSTATQPHVAKSTSRGGYEGQTGPTEGGRAVPNRNCGVIRPDRGKHINRAVGRFTRGRFCIQFSRVIAYLKQEFPSFKTPNPRKTTSGKPISQRSQRERASPIVRKLKRITIWQLPIPHGSISFGCWSLLFGFTSEVLPTKHGEERLSKSEIGYFQTW